MIAPLCSLQHSTSGLYVCRLSTKDTLKALMQAFISSWLDCAICNVWNCFETSQCRILQLHLHRLHSDSHARASSLSGNDQLLLTAACQRAASATGHLVSASSMGQNCKTQHGCSMDDLRNLNPPLRTHH